MTTIDQPVIHTLANGVRLVCDPIPGLETLALSVAVGRGSRFETPRQSGWAHLLEHMVFKGAGERSAREIVEVIEAEGGQINAATGHDRTSFQVRALRGGLPLGMAVIADLVQRPKLDADDLAREKPVINQEIAEAADTPDDLVFELAQAAAFAGQPLGRPILGTPRTVGAATPEQLSAFHASLYAPDAIVIAAAGAVDEGQLLALAEDLFARAGHEHAARADRGGPPALSAARRPRPRPWSRRIWSCCSPLSGCVIRTISPCACWRKSSAAACLPVCSRRCGSIWASPTPSTPMPTPTATPACWASMPEPRARMRPEAAKVSAAQNAGADRRGAGRRNWPAPRPS